MARWTTTLTRSAGVFVTWLAFAPAVVLGGSPDVSRRIFQAVDDAISIPYGLDDVTRALVLSPIATDDPETTHAALVITRKSYAGHVSFAGRVQTVRQLRQGSSPNPWECAWLVWNYQDEQHFYYVAIKATGWEVGKRDPAYAGGQRFLASGDEEFPIGTWHGFNITQQDNTITIGLNGVEVASISDAERPYAGGQLGLYAEDAEVQLDDITTPFAEDFERYSAQASSTDGFVIQDWIAPFLGYGFVAIADRGK